MEEGGTANWKPPDVPWLPWCTLGTKQCLSLPLLGRMVDLHSSVLELTLTMPDASQEKLSRLSSGDLWPL